ncbi:MAG: peptidoglycan DD-metalloendopeptidase family protein [Chlorobi bacterium]|nr:peptidoglycan DD-metalloendopeptidase family protein [Chlorobiota bacterium]
MRILFFILGLSLAVLPYRAGAQTRAELEKKRERLRREINRINADLKRTRSEEKNLLQTYELTRRKIALRQKLIDNLQKEIRILDRRIARKKDTVRMLEDEIARLRENYAQAVRRMYKFGSREKVLYFVLSSESFRQAWRRMRYVKEYGDFVKKKARELQKKEAALKEALKRLETEKMEKNNMLTVLSDEQRRLRAEKGRLEKMLADLKKQKRKYLARIRAMQREARRVDRLIQKRIEEEIARSNRGKGGGFALTPEGKQLASRFSANKGKLPWPVKRGYVSRRFGRRPHPVYKNIMVYNSGIYINVPDDEPVRAVFDGQVMGVQIIPGGNQTLLIRHGNYITVYGNLKEVYVKKGQKVHTGQVVGKVAKDPANGNISVLKFRIYQNRQKLDPELWLARK